MFDRGHVVPTSPLRSYNSPSVLLSLSRSFRLQIPTPAREGGSRLYLGTHPQRVPSSVTTLPRVSPGDRIIRVELIKPFF